MKKFVCSVCGYVAEGKIRKNVRYAMPKADKFVAMQEGKREWADQHVIGVAKDVDPEVVQGLRDNFNGECSEVGMYGDEPPSRP